MTFYAHYSLVKKEDWPLKWFTPREIASKGNGSLLVNIDALLRLDAMRERIGKPMIINSAYRDPLYNAKVGGAPMSMHKFGRAFDVSLSGHHKSDLIRMAREVGFTGFGVNYRTFLHIDTGRARQW